MLKMQGLEWLLQYSLLNLYRIFYGTVQSSDCNDVGDLQNQFYKSRQNMRVLVYADVKRAFVGDGWCNS